MDGWWDTPVEIGVGAVRVVAGLGIPPALGVYRQNADLTEHFEDADDPAGHAFVAVGDASEWPQLVVTQRFHPAGAGFAPGVLVVPEHQQVFIGAGTRLLAYHSRDGQWRRQWVEKAEVGFWGWRRHGDVVVMAAELELAAWTTDGRRLWTTFVEPPWTYRVDGGRVSVDVMGELRTFDLGRGPSA